MSKTFYPSGQRDQKPNNKTYNNRGYDNAPTTIGGKVFDEWKPSIQKWIKESIDKETIDFADGLGKVLKDGNLTTSQIRNVFGEMRKIQMNGFETEKTNFILLKAKLAYTSKRHDTKGMEQFYKLFSELYNHVDASSIDGEKHFQNLMQIMEAVLAFHKFHGGKEN